MVAALRVLEQATHRVVPSPKFIKLPSIPDVPDEQVDIIAAMFVAAVKACVREEDAAVANELRAL